MKSIGRAHRSETEIATSTLPRIAFEYRQIARAPWTSRSAVRWSIPAMVTASAAANSKPPVYFD
jgi:hypothetical protein